MTHVTQGAERSAPTRGELTIAALAAFPLFVGLLNLRALSRAPSRSNVRSAGISVLIPARNEGAQIETAIMTALANGPAVREVLVLDDGSQDDTAARVEAIADKRVRLLHGRPLPEGWCGKNHACAQLAAAATQEWLLFIDADVRLEERAIPRLLAVTEGAHAPSLISGVPRQEMRSGFEWLLLPFIDVLLFGYLPLVFDKGRTPALAAACGQLVMVKAEAYRHSGGHGQIRDKLHDGLALAREMRRAGFRTRLIDATDLATCRMYRNGREVYAGLMKNAVEGLAGPVALPIWTLLLGGGHVLPFLLRGTPTMQFARLASLALRLLVALRCQQGLRTVLASPVGVFMLLFIQFHARLRHVLGRPVTWKGRYYET